MVVKKVKRERKGYRWIKREKKKRKEIRRAHLISPISSLPSHPPDSAYAA
jgi:hypothetical protein